MNNKQLKRLTFLGENKMLVDDNHLVEIKKSGSGRKFVHRKDKKSFNNEQEMFDYIDEMTGAGGAVGSSGLELPLAADTKSNFLKKKAAPYNQIVDIYEEDLIPKVEKLVKEALIKEFVEQKSYPAQKIVKSYRDANAKASEDNLKEIESGIKIMYGNILPPQIRNYYQDDNDYNGDGVPNQLKSNHTLLDLQYDGVPKGFKENLTKELKKDPQAVILMDAAKKKREYADKSNLANIQQIGRDFEIKTNKPQSDSRGGVAMLGFALNENKMSKFSFKSDKYDFKTNPEQLDESIPNKVKKNGVKFQMEDSKGNSYLIEWNDNGGQILEYKNILFEQKQIDKMNNLFEFKNWDKQSKSKKIDFEYFTKKDKKKTLKEENDVKTSMKEDVEELNADTNFNLDTVEAALTALIEKYGGRRYLGFVSGESGAIEFVYLDMNDSDQDTIIFDKKNEKYFIKNLLDFLEEDKIEKELDTDQRKEYLDNIPASKIMAELGQTISKFNDGKEEYDISGESNGPFGEVSFEEFETALDYRVILGFSMEDKVEDAYSKLKNSDLNTKYKIEMDEDDPSVIVVVTAPK